MLYFGYFSDRESPRSDGSIFKFLVSKVHPSSGSYHFEGQYLTTAFLLYFFLEWRIPNLITGLSRS